MKEKAGSNRQEWNLVFPTENGTPMVVKNDWKQWQNALNLCGISLRGLLDARHNTATLLYASGVDIETISRAIGHSSNAITSFLYVHSEEEPLR